MSTLEQLDTSTFSQEHEDTAETQPRIAGFKTAQGSVYRYDAEGRTTRFKAATGEQLDKQDITVLSPLSIEDEQDYLLAYRSDNPDRDTKVYVVERQQDDKAQIVRDISEVHDPDNIYLAVVKNGRIVKNNKAVLQPVVGYNVFDTRQFQENGQTMTERHLGNRVTEMLYDNSGS